MTLLRRLPENARRRGGEWGSRMGGYGRVGAAAAVVAAVVALAGGCAQPAGSAAPGAPAAPRPTATPSGTLADTAGTAAAGAFGKGAAQADIDAATAAAGLPASGSPGTRAPSPPPSGRPVSELDALVARGWACSAIWSAVGPLGGPGEPEAPRAKFDATLKELVARGWAAGKQTEEPLDGTSATGGGNGTAVFVMLTKRNWSLQARHTEAGSLWAMAFTATEDACEARFTERELKLMEEAGDRRTRGGVPRDRN
ncbi:hypothetical protein [Streptomyces sp. NPDC051211]|uniref:hypothetical protein n=1 Tax=Streptomyces sp. NPDC051211 TaxID=3154643 RepID=UPI00344C7B2F